MPAAFVNYLNEYGLKNIAQLCPNGFFDSHLNCPALIFFFNRPVFIVVIPMQSVQVIIVFIVSMAIVGDGGVFATLLVSVSVLPMGVVLTIYFGLWRLCSARAAHADK